MKSRVVTVRKSAKKMQLMLYAVVFKSGNILRLLNVRAKNCEIFGNLTSFSCNLVFFIEVFRKWKKLSKYALK